MLLCRGWLKKIMKYQESIRGRRSNPRLIWYCLRTRRELFWGDRRRWRNMKTRWLEDMPSNSKRDKKRLSYRRRQLRRLRSRSSNNWRLKNRREELSPNSKSVLEMNFMTRSQKRQPKQRNVLRLKRELESEKNCNWQEITRWDWRQRGNKRRREWRKNSRRNWWRSSQRMRDLNRWMLKEDACASWNTNAK